MKNNISFRADLDYVYIEYGQNTKIFVLENFLNKVCISKSVNFQRIKAFVKVYRFACAHFRWGGSSIILLLLSW